MESKMCILLCLIMVRFHLVCVLGGRVVSEAKEEAATPLTKPSPPEGNTTFIGGTTWCVALTSVPAVQLQTALNWACGPGSTDCSSLQPGGPCFEPNTLLSHASFAFNSYYQQNGNSDIACNFGGTAIITRKNPSYASCVYLSSEPPASSSSRTRRKSRNVGIGLLQYLEIGLLFM
ncbi:hypothetical protein IEQ34_013816 [Dendrobium chrysotoxum]|uniref:X8 domain-containing protein n=1 Tax=Dendrobium chrysotoxum TaxID=161865 RepID=A0AAV7GPI8_DENCH|nr:hypothetical protein IEQ34_013816 [Dendrobium chrysotoxum]